MVLVHVPIRLARPDGPDEPCELALVTSDLEDAFRHAAAMVRLDVGPLCNDTAYRLGWGVQVDCRSITGDTARQRRMSRVVHPEQVAAYLAK